MCAAGLDELLVWVPGVRGGGGVRLKDTIIITAKSGEPLTRAAFDDRLLL
jgi:Xaa-Pro aminopeptidase